MTNLGSRGNELTSKGLIPTCHPIHEEKMMSGNSNSRQNKGKKMENEFLQHIQAAKNPEHQGRMKHMNPIYHGFRESVELGEVAPYYIPTLAMPADILTKALDRVKVLACNKMLGLGL